MFYIKIRSFGLTDAYYVGMRGKTFNELSLCNGNGYATEKRARAAMYRIVERNEQNGIDNKLYNIVFKQEEE
jgi:hypothetical protein